MSAGTSTLCPRLETGKSSVTPCTKPITMAWKKLRWAGTARRSQGSPLFANCAASEFGLGFAAQGLLEVAASTSPPSLREPHRRTEPSSCERMVTQNWRRLFGVRPKGVSSPCSTLASSTRSSRIRPALDRPVLVHALDGFVDAGEAVRLIARAPVGNVAAPGRRPVRRRPAARLSRSPAGDDFRRRPLGELRRSRVAAVLPHRRRRGRVPAADRA